LQEAGVDICDVSAGQTSIAARPVYGRMFQTPFSDRIRNETGMATMAVGNIFEPDHVNSILMAGRADLVCLARPHLADPAWTLHAAAKIGVKTVPWPKQYFAGKAQFEANVERAATAVTSPESTPPLNRIPTGTSPTRRRSSRASADPASVRRYFAVDIREILRQEQEHQIDLATALGEEVPDVGAGR